MTSAPQSDRRSLLVTAIWLNAYLVLWNVVEGVIAIILGSLANSVALLGFGIDSVIEVTSSAVLIWRMRTELRGGSVQQAERVERTAGRIAGSLLLILAAYIVVDSIRRLAGFGAAADQSGWGIVLTVASLIVMPALGFAKLRIAGKLDSRSLRADAYETITCAWLSLTTLVGLSLNAALGWSWADPLAALLIVPLLIREGREAFHGEHECG